MGIKFGRIPSTDLRNHDFLTIRKAVKQLHAKKTWNAGDGTKFDQGDTPQCVSYAANRLLVAAPHVNKMPETFENFYHHVQELDGSPLPHDGSSVHAAMKYLKQIGLVTAYRWAYSTQAVTNFLLTTGPMDVGTDWTNNMFQPTNSGFIQVGASYDVAGGHSYLLNGVDLRKKCPDGTIGAYRMTNSWGLSWGDHGGAWISIRDFGILLNHQGECSAPTEK
jgi:hypothetical protein